jgi:hypothetical protein
MAQRNDTDQRTNSPLLGGTVSDSSDALHFFRTETFGPNEIDPQFFLVSIVVIVPFVMLIYFGLAIIINDTINLGPGMALPLRLSLSSKMTPVAMLTYVGLSA